MDYNMEVPSIMPDSATFAVTPVIPMAAQLLLTSRTLLDVRVDTAPPRKGFDLVLCDICDKEVRIHWQLDEAGAQVHDVEAHDRECHVVCMHCHDLVTTGVFPRDVPGKGVKLYSHDKLCPAQQNVRHCTHCGVAFADKEWFLRDHLGPCIEAAQQKGSMDSYSKTNGEPSVIGGLHWRDAQAGTNGGEGREHATKDATLFAYSDGAAVAAPEPGMIESTTLSKNNGSKSARETSGYVHFYCEHCGIGVTNDTWYLQHHLVQCAGGNKATQRMFSKHTGLKKKREKTHLEADLDVGKTDSLPQGTLPGDPYRLGAIPRGKKLEVEAPRKPSTSTFALTSRPKSAKAKSSGLEGAVQEVHYYCGHCGVGVTDDRCYRREHLDQCIAEHKGRLGMYSEQTGLRKEKRQKPRGGAKIDRYISGAVARDTERGPNVLRKRPIADMKAIPLSGTEGTGIILPESEAMAKDIIFHCQCCSIAVTNQDWYLQEHLSTCVEVARDLGALERQMQDIGETEVPEEVREPSAGAGSEDGEIVQTPAASAVNLSPSRKSKGKGKVRDTEELAEDILFDYPRCGLGWAASNSFFAHLDTCEEVAGESRACARGSTTPVRGRKLSTPQSRTPVSPLTRPARKPGPQNSLQRRKGARQVSSKWQYGREKKKAEPELPY